MNSDYRTCFSKEKMRIHTHPQLPQGRRPSVKLGGCVCKPVHFPGKASNRAIRAVGIKDPPAVSVENGAFESRAISRHFAIVPAHSASPRDLEDPVAPGIQLRGKYFGLGKEFQDYLTRCQQYKKFHTSFSFLMQTGKYSGLNSGKLLWPSDERKSIYKPFQKKLFVYNLVILDFM